MWLNESEWKVGKRNGSGVLSSGIRLKYLKYVFVKSKVVFVEFFICGNGRRCRVESILWCY